MNMAQEVNMSMKVDVLAFFRENVSCVTDKRIPNRRIDIKKTEPFQTF